jgi:CHAT domain-containing protein
MLSHRYQASYLFDKATETYKSGDLDYYRWRNESIKFIQNSSSKLLTWSELGLMINLMYQSINLGEPETAIEISSVMETRLEIKSEKSSREFEIYNRFTKNLFFEEEYWRGFNLVLTWILNLTSALDDLFPEKYEDFLERRSYLLEFVNDAVKKEHYTDSSLADWNSDTASKLASKADTCEMAETFYELAFNYYQEEFDDIAKTKAELTKLGSNEFLSNNQIFNTDPFGERIDLARCFLREENFSKANLYLSQASYNLENYAYDKTFYKSWIDIISAKLAMSENDHNSAFAMLQEGSNHLFQNEIKLSSTLDKDKIAMFINDYIDVSMFLKTKNFNTQGWKNFAELEAFKNRLLSNRRLEQIKIDNNKANIKSLKSDLQFNKTEISKYEELLETNFEEKYLTKIDRLFKSRKKIISKMLGKNRELDSLFNPSYVSYQKIASSLDDQSIMLTYNLATDSGKLIAQTDSETFIFNITDGMPLIQSNITSLRASMDLGSSFNFKAAHNLYEILLKPLEPLLSDIKNIYLYGSDLEDLPFGVLLSNYNELEEISSDYEKLLQSQWLIESYSFARIFPLSNDQLNYEYDHKFLGLANPDSFETLGLSDLPNAEEEIRQIALVSKSYSQDFLLTNSNASKENLRARLSESYERIVFSTHSLPPNWNGITSESSLVLSDKAGDYLLTATEIINMDFKSDMVVLSSCNTEKKGSDSLYKAFLVAGSNSVMYSNWELETISASKITDEMFKSMLFDDAPKHIALQNASIKLMNDYSNRDYAHPGFWGNFSIAYRNL